MHKQFISINLEICCKADVDIKDKLLNAWHDPFWNFPIVEQISLILESSSLAEGNDTQKPLDIRLGQTVTNINIDDITERVEVVTSNGDVYFADAAVISVSLGILKSGQITFSPSLPEYKQTSTDRLGINFAHVPKYALS